MAPPLVCKQSQVLETGSLNVVFNSVKAMNSVLNAFWKTASKGMPIIMTVCAFFKVLWTSENENMLVSKQSNNDRARQRVFRDLKKS